MMKFREWRVGALAAGAAIALSGCVIVVDGDDDDDDDMSFRMSLGGDIEVETADPIEETLEPFSGISAAAGSDVQVRQGSTHMIALDDRAAATVRYRVVDGSLKIDCQRPCRNGAKGQVVVTTPDLTALSASSGAELIVSEGFDAISNLALSASSGAELDASELVATTVSASVSSGADIELTASDALQASASSGGSIRYHGEPENVQASKSSGGSIKARR